MTLESRRAEASSNERDEGHCRKARERRRRKSSKTRRRSGVAFLPRTSKPRDSTTTHSVLGTTPSTMASLFQRSSLLSSFSRLNLSSSSSSLPIPSTSTPLFQPSALLQVRNKSLVPRRTKYRKAHKGRTPIALGGSTKGTTLEWGDYGLRVNEACRLSAKHLETAEAALKRALKPTRGSKV